MTRTIAKPPPLPPPVHLPVGLGGGVPPAELPGAVFDDAGFDGAVLCDGDDELDAGEPEDEGAEVAAPGEGEAVLLVLPFPRRRERLLLAPF